MKLIVANWKMNLNPAEASLFMHKIVQKITPVKGVTVVLCPPYLDIYSMGREMDRKKFQLGAQNLYPLDHGAYTGEVSAAMLKDLVDYAIVGHSERRQHFGEDDKLIGQKVAAALRHGIKPVLCIGENLADRQAGHSTKVVTDQLEADLSGVTAAEMKDVIIAYEPVWAIGTGDYAKPDEVMPIINAIRGTVEELYGEPAGQEIKVLYGGSVGPDNAAAYLSLAGIDGLLVGGASLNYEMFAPIVAAAKTSS